MKDIVFKRQALVLIIAGIAALLVVSTIVASLVLHSVQGSPNLAGAPETSGCATPLAPRENMLYVLAHQITAPLNPQGPLYISAVDTNGRQSWTQLFTDFSPAVASNTSVEARNGIVYVFATAFVKQSNLSRVAAYDAKSGKQLWNFQVPNAQVQPSSSNGIAGMAICNTMMYLWTPSDLYAYNAMNGSLLWQGKGVLPQTGSTPHVEVTDTALVFAGSYPVKSAQGTISFGNAINALNPKNGAPLWKMNIPPYNPPQEPSFAAQGLSFTATERAVYLDVLNPGSPQKVAALSISTGKELWNISVGKPVADDSHFPSAIVSNNILYVSTSNSGVVAINTNDGRYLWQDPTIVGLKPLQDKLYVNHTNLADAHPKMPDLCQLDPLTGKSQWCQSLPSYADELGMATATSDQTTVYVPLVDGLHAVQKNTGKLKWIYKGNNTPGKAQMATVGLSFDY